MIVSLIVAVDKSMGIGYKNKLPWHLPYDLKRFKKITMGHHLLMGRRTYESIGRPLPGRKMLMVSRSPVDLTAGVEKFDSIISAVYYAKSNGEDELFIIGGGKLFSQTICMAQRIYLTKVMGEFKSDTYFPPIDATRWQVSTSSQHAPDTNNIYPHSFQILERILN